MGYTKYRDLVSPGLVFDALRKDGNASILLPGAFVVKRNMILFFKIERCRRLWWTSKGQND